MNREVKYEIERRFLWSYDCDCTFESIFDNIPHVKDEYISDVYLTDRVRIRRVNNQYFLTVKGEGTTTRSEFEVPLNNIEFLSSAFISGANFLNKRRVTYDIDGQLYEVNLFSRIEYNNLPLILIECELNREDQPIWMPQWIGKEVTNDKRFNGCSLFTLLEYNEFNVKEK